MPDLLDGHEPPVDHDQMLHEIERELTMRRNVYPKMIQSGRLKPGEARARFRVLEAVRDLVVNVKVRGIKNGRPV